MSLSKYLLLILCLSFCLLLGCKNQSYSNKLYELKGRDGVVSDFDYLTVKKELEKLTTDCTKDCFLILASLDADGSYLQTYYDTDQKQFVLEYQDGDESNHFQEATGSLTLVEIEKVFKNYYNKTINWDVGINWQQLEIM